MYINTTLWFYLTSDREDGYPWENKKQQQKNCQQEEKKKKLLDLIGGM